MTTIEPALRYPGISAQAFAHPADRAARAALQSVPMLDTAIKKLTEFAYERRLRQLLLGNAVRLGEDQVPAVWAMQRQCAFALDLDVCPKLYVTHDPIGNALTIGTNEPVTLVLSGLVASYSDDELRAVLAHEMGHVLADHVGLTTALRLAEMLVKGFLRPTGPLMSLPILAVYYSLLEWSRMAELTADRASALVTADPRVVCHTLMRLAGGPVRDMNLDAFIKQATEYEGEADPLARWMRLSHEIKRTHPFPVRRVRELVEWVTSGDYDRIRRGDYVHRGHEPPSNTEFDATFRHYRSRFSRMAERAGSGIQTVVDRVSTWLDPTRNGSNPPPEDFDDFADEET